MLLQVNLLISEHWPDIVAVGLIVVVPIAIVEVPTVVRIVLRSRPIVTRDDVARVAFTGRKTSRRPLLSGIQLTPPSLNQTDSRKRIQGLHPLRQRGSPKSSTLAPLSQGLGFRMALNDRFPCGRPNYLVP